MGLTQPARSERDGDPRAWRSGDLPLLERLMGDPRTTEHLDAPESPECGSLLGGGGRAPGCKRSA
jgi:hypothetical protein